MSVNHLGKSLFLFSFFFAVVQVEQVAAEVQNADVPAQESNQGDDQIVAKDPIKRPDAGDYQNQETNVIAESQDELGEQKGKSDRLEQEIDEDAPWWRSEIALLAAGAIVTFALAQLGTRLQKRSVFRANMYRVDFTGYENALRDYLGVHFAQLSEIEERITAVSDLPYASRDSYLDLTSTLDGQAYYRDYYGVCWDIEDWTTDLPANGGKRSSGLRKANQEHRKSLSKLRTQLDRIRLLLQPLYTPSMLGNKDESREDIEELRAANVAAHVENTLTLRKFGVEVTLDLVKEADYERAVKDAAASVQKTLREHRNVSERLEDMLDKTAAMLAIG